MRRCVKGCRGFTLIEVMIAMIVVGAAILGTLAMILAVQSHNRSSSEVSTAYKSCEKVMEQILSTPYDQVTAWHGAKFVAKNLHPTLEIGEVSVVDISPPGAPGSVVEIEVKIENRDIAVRPVNAVLVTRRSR